MAKKLLVIGAHPDDPEAAAGGLMARHAALGNEVVCVYFTRGEAGIDGVSNDEAARIRTEEGLRACEIMQARPVFFGQIDGACEINTHWYAEMAALFERERPDAVVTHWAIDTHRDHRVAASLVYDAWWRGGCKSALYYFETLTGWQSQLFNPTDYVDITDYEPVKRKACAAHVSQGYADDALYARELEMARFRGYEAGCRYAEAFIRHPRSQPFVL
jgi:LmbE family N-acetylglucosaminyl deacetylase